MAEQISNLATTTLATAITTVGQTSITVNTATGFPTSSDYRILIDNELMLVTAGAGTTTWTVTRQVESTTATTHNAGAKVSHVLTAASLINVIHENTAISYDLSPQLNADLDLNGYDIITTAVGGNINVGNNNENTSTFGLATGEYAQSYVYGQQVRAAGRFEETGDAQISTVISRCATTDDAWHELYPNGNDELLIIPQLSAWTFTITVVCRDEGAGSEGTQKAGSFSFQGGLSRGYTTAQFTGASTPTVNVIAVDDLSLDCRLSIKNWGDDGNYLSIEGKGLSGSNFRWVARIEITEVRVASDGGSHYFSAPDPQEITVAQTNVEQSVVGSMPVVGNGVYDNGLVVMADGQSMDVTDWLAVAMQQSNKPLLLVNNRSVEEWSRITGKKAETLWARISKKLPNSKVLKR